MTPTTIPIIVNSGSRAESSYTIKCLETSELSDVYQKYLANEELSEQDAERVLECVTEKREAMDIVGNVIKIGMGLLILGLIGAIVYSFLY